MAVRVARVSLLLVAAAAGLVVLDEGLYRDPSLLRAEHATILLSLFGPGFPLQSQMVDLT